MGIVDETYYTSEMLGDVLQTVLQFVYWEANLNRIYVYCASDNSVLLDTLDHSPFTHEGQLRHEIYRNGDYLDRHIYSILQREWEGNSL